MANEHIIMFPYMAQGHLIPFLALAKLITKRFPTYTVTLINTPLNIRNLQPSLPPDSNSIRLLALPFRGPDFGLPPGSENSDSLPATHLVRLSHASESLRPDFTRSVSDLARKHGRAPLLIIADVFFGWTVEIARELGSFHVSFTTCGAYGTAAYFSLWLHLPHFSTDSQEFHIPGFPDTFRIHRSQLSSYLRAADGQDLWSRFFRRNISFSLKSDGMICNTAEEIEIEGLRLLRAISKLRVWAIGPLVPLDSNTSKDRVAKKASVEVEEIVKWLDSQETSSVVYVSFGSQNTIPSSQMMSLAIGLESSGHPFVWVVRPPIGFDLNSDFRPEWLPNGFESRVREKKQGLLIRGWAPQLEILSHKSTGAFLTHCGWNSVLESLSRGVPMIMWPLAAEQFYNSKMVEEELGVGVELARGATEEVRSEEVERVVRLVVGQWKGKEMRAKVMKFKEAIRDAVRDDGEGKGSSIMAIEEFIGEAIRSRSEKK